MTWEKKIAASKGRIDVAMAEQFLADHEDSYTGRTRPTSVRSVGMSMAREGVPEWGWGPNFPGGAVTGKVADPDMART